MKKPLILIIFLLLLLSQTTSHGINSRTLFHEFYNLMFYIPLKRKLVAIILANYVCLLINQQIHFDITSRCIRIGTNGMCLLCEFPGLYMINTWYFYF